MVELVSWEVFIPMSIVTIGVQALSGVIYVRWVWPWARGRKVTEWMMLAFGATTPLVLMAGLFALIGRRPGDVIIAGSCFLMWIGQLPFMFAGLPLLDAMLAERRLAEEKDRGLAEVRDAPPDREGS